MINAAAMWACLWALWLLASPGAPRVVWAAEGAGAALLCVLLAWRLLGLEKPGAFAATPAAAWLAVQRAPRVLHGAWTTVRAALALRPKLKPALVRVRTRPGSGEAQAALAMLLSAAPGAVVIDTDAESLLAHVLDEDAVDAQDWTRLETRVLGAVDGGRAS